MIINPFANSNPMSWVDAAKVSIILAFAAFFTVFLISYDYASIQENYVNFIFESVRFFGGIFFTNFVALAGLTQLTKKKANDKKEKLENID